MKKKMHTLFIATTMLCTTAYAELVTTFHVDEDKTTLLFPKLEVFYRGSSVGIFKAEMELIPDNSTYDFRVISSSPLSITLSNEDIVRRFLGEFLSEGNLEVAEEILSPEIIIHTLDSFTPDFGNGIEAMKQVVNFYREAFSDFQMIIDDLIVTGDKAIARFTLSGKHTGDLPNFPATGATISADGMETYSIVNGKIVAFWHVLDTFGVRTILTTAPPPESDEPPTCISHHGKVCP
jgi:predicted ester cyclase